MFQPSSLIKKIAIFRVLQLGDMLCCVPALRALRHQFPDAHITLLGLPWAKSFVERFNHLLDEFIWFPGIAGFPEQHFDACRTAEFFSDFCKQHYDFILQMQGNGSIINPIIPLFGAKLSGGFTRENEFAEHPAYYLQYPEGIHEIDRHLALMKHLGIELQGRKLEFPITGQDLAELEGAELRLEPNSYVCVHAGSRGAWRQWPIPFFAGLADVCAASGKQVVLTGTKEEVEIVSQVKTEMKYPAIVAAGRTSLGALAVLIRDAFALISNCTGPSHIAAALETPSIIISMDGEPERWAPINTGLHYTIDWTRTPDFQEVFSKTQELLKRSQAIELC
ncbi:MAG TPA: glycosyltransferase family 9 protein [Flavitalea sp.]|nr:glycosyltransferase family 9 protein [Flavitalea sp.]